jgi:hypothetical protein
VRKRKRRNDHGTGKSGRFRLMCVGIGGVFSGGARAVVDWVLRTAGD